MGRFKNLMFSGLTSTIIELRDLPDWSLIRSVFPEEHDCGKILYFSCVQEEFCDKNRYRLTLTAIREREMIWKGYKRQEVEFLLNFCDKKMMKIGFRHIYKLFASNNRTIVLSSSNDKIIWNDMRL